VGPRCVRLHSLSLPPYSLCWLGPLARAGLGNAMPLMDVYHRHQALIDALGIGVQRAVLVVKASVAAWAAFLACSLGSSPQCLVSPHVYEDTTALRCLLGAWAAAVLVQIWAPPWLLLDFSLEELPRKLTGVVAMILSTLILVAIPLVALMPPSYGRTKRAGCADAVTIGPLGVFELCAFFAIMEGPALMASVFLAAFCSGGVLFLLAVSMPLSVPVAFLLASRDEKKRQNELQTVLSQLELVACVGQGMPTACCICLESFEQGDSCMRLPCHAGHVFHTECLQYWLERSRRCPLCRSDIFSQVLSSARARRPVVEPDPEQRIGNDIIFSL